MAFKAKDLHYEKQEPAFLRRLRGEVGGDRQNVSIARPSKPRLDTGDDDGPTIVDEAGESVTKEEYDAMSRNTDSGNDPKTAGSGNDAGSIHAPHGDDTTQDAERAKVSEKLASIGSSGKRKFGKVIGHDDERGGEKTGHVNGKPEEVVNGSKSTDKLKPKSKKKKIKLSFDEDGP